MSWTILWQTHQRPDTENWNIATALTEAGALDVAKHFVALGFPVHAIRSPSGDIYMDEGQIAARYAPHPA